MRCSLGPDPVAALDADPGAVRDALEVRIGGTSCRLRQKRRAGATPSRLPPSRSSGPPLCRERIPLDFPALVDDRAEPNFRAELEFDGLDVPVALGLGRVF